MMQTNINQFITPTTAVASVEIRLTNQVSVKLSRNKGNALRCDRTIVNRSFSLGTYF